MNKYCSKWCDDQNTCAWAVVHLGRLVQKGREGAKTKAVVVRLGKATEEEDAEEVRTNRVPFNLRVEQKAVLYRDLDAVKSAFISSKKRMADVLHTSIGLVDEIAKRTKLELQAATDYEPAPQVLSEPLTRPEQEAEDAALTEHVRGLVTILQKRKLREQGSDYAESSLGFTVIFGKNKSMHEVLEGFVGNEGRANLLKDVVEPIISAAFRAGDVGQPKNKRKLSKNKMYSR